MQTDRSITSPEQNEKKQRRFWGSMIVGLLGLQVFGSLLTAFVATTSDSMAVIPDYHQKSIDWDSRQAAAAKSQQLNWDVTLAVSPVNDLTSDRIITVTLVDADNEPVDAESAELVGFPLQGTSQSIRIPLQLSDNGQYGASWPQPQLGGWEWELHVKTKNSLEYMATIHVDLNEDAGFWTPTWRTP